MLFLMHQWVTFIDLTQASSNFSFKAGGGTLAGGRKKEAGFGNQMQKPLS